MHVHMTIFWTIVLGIIGSIIGGAVTHIFLRPKNERYHPAGLIFSTLGAILVLYICYKLKIHFPEVTRLTSYSDRTVTFWAHGATGMPFSCPLPPENDKATMKEAGRVW